MAYRRRLRAARWLIGYLAGLSEGGGRGHGCVLGGRRLLDAGACSGSALRALHRPGAPFTPLTALLPPCCRPATTLLPRARGGCPHPVAAHRPAPLGGGSR